MDGPWLISVVMSKFSGSPPAETGQQKKCQPAISSCGEHQPAMKRADNHSECFDARLGRIVYSPRWTMSTKLVRSVVTYFSFSLRSLSDLRASAVNITLITLTAETQRTQRRRREFQIRTLP